MLPELKDWLQRAQYDLLSARHLRTNERIPGGVAAFHYQQAAEKALKGLILAGGSDPERTHDLRALLTRVPRLSDLDEDAAESLTSFAVLARYPGFSAQVPGDELDAFDRVAHASIEALARVVNSADSGQT